MRNLIRTWARYSVISLFSTVQEVSSTSIDSIPRSVFAASARASFAACLQLSDDTPTRSIVLTTATLAPPPEYPESSREPRPGLVRPAFYVLGGPASNMAARGRAVLRREGRLVESGAVGRGLDPDPHLGQGGGAGLGRGGVGDEPGRGTPV